MNTKFYFISICNLLFILFTVSVHAASPLFTFTPITSTNLQLRSNNTAIVQYTVQNQSKRTHTLVMKPITGVSQITRAGNCGSIFVLQSKQSCTLTLQINGSQLTGNIQSGPEVCQATNGQPNPLLCYQPSQANSLNVTLLPALLFYAGTQNGDVYYSLNNGISWMITITQPAGGSAINSIYVFGNIIYAGAANGFIYLSINNGNSWNALTPPDGSAVMSVFVFGNTIYAGTANGFLYYSNNGGITWQRTTAPDGSSVNAIFVVNDSIYVGTANGFVYVSTDAGATWISINGTPDGSAVRSVFVVNGSIYVGTTNEFVYVSTSLTGGGSWAQFAQTVYTLFVTSDNNLFAGTQSGHVFSLSIGEELGFVNYSPINALFIG